MFIITSDILFCVRNFIMNGQLLPKKKRKRKRHTLRFLLNTGTYSSVYNSLVHWPSVRNFNSVVPRLPNVGYEVMNFLRNPLLASVTQLNSLDFHLSKELFIKKNAYMYSGEFCLNPILITDLITQQHFHLPKTDVNFMEKKKGNNKLIIPTFIIAFL